MKNTLHIVLIAALLPCLLFLGCVAHGQNPTTGTSIELDLVQCIASQYVHKYYLGSEWMDSTEGDW